MLEIDIQDDRFNPWNQDFTAALVVNDIDLIGASLEDINQGTQYFIIFINHLQTKQLVVIIFALLQRRPVRSKDMYELVAKFCYLFPHGVAFKLDQNTASMLTSFN